MSYYDLNIAHPAAASSFALLEKLGYDAVAINYFYTGKIQPNTAIANPVKSYDNTKIKQFTRLTLPLEDSSLNYNLSLSAREFDILAIRPTNEKTLQYACTQMEVDIISLDLSLRLPYYLKYSTIGSAHTRGVFLEICYAASIRDTAARRNLFSNAANLVRATKGRGLIISSEASEVLSLRGPHDLINLATFWGLNQEKGRESISENPRKVVVKADTRKNVHKGVLRVLEVPAAIKEQNLKRAQENKAEGKINKKKQKM